MKCINKVNICCSCMCFCFHGGEQKLLLLAERRKVRSQLFKLRNRETHIHRYTSKLGVLVKYTVEQSISCSTLQNTSHGCGGVEGWDALRQVHQGD
uniref:Uncharacterized protein n=1 Tax=Oryza brachyantha TaxID=4533 RepID=J3L5E4_ORYBR